MKLSVIIPNYNDLRITRALESVTRQSYPSTEIIIVDGGSTNESLLAFYRSCGAHKVVVERDEGIFDALNKGIRLATGDIIYQMGSDDQLSDDSVFRDVVNAFKDRSLDGVCIGCEFVNAEGTIIRSWHPKSVSAGRIKRGIMPPHFSLFLKREIYGLVGEYKHSQYQNVACDSIWLMDLAIRKSDLRIDMLPNHHLRMEYGGASTRSLSAIVRQFRVVHAYARANASNIPWWYLLSPVKTLSKVSQLKLFRR